MARVLLLHMIKSRPPSHSGGAGAASPVLRRGSAGQGYAGARARRTRRRPGPRPKRAGPSGQGLPPARPFGMEETACRKRALTLLESPSGLQDPAGGYRRSRRQAERQGPEYAGSPGGPCRSPRSLAVEGFSVEPPSYLGPAFPPKSASPFPLHTAGPGYSRSGRTPLETCAISGRGSRGPHRRSGR